MGHKELPFYCSGFVIHSESVGGAGADLRPEKRAKDTAKGVFCFVLLCSERRSVGGEGQPVAT